jgi:hypothetical protein
MIDFHFANFAKLVFAFLLALSQSPAKTASAHVAVLKPGDEISGMRLTNDSANARPLWAFCSSEINKNVTTASCRVPRKISKLAIGHAFLPRDNAFSNMEWSELEWQLYIDDNLINLDDFGTYNYILPTMAPNPSLVREVFMRFTAWDVVLTSLQPGTHSIDGSVRAGDEEYSWVVSLVIEDRSATQEGTSSQEDSTDSPSQCHPNVKTLSDFHHSCRLYGLKLEAMD